MNRRSFIGALAALPIVGKAFAAKPEATSPSPACRHANNEHAVGPPWPRYMLVRAAENIACGELVTWDGCSADGYLIARKATEDPHMAWNAIAKQARLAVSRNVGQKGDILRVQTRG